MGINWHWEGVLFWCSFNPSVPAPAHGSLLLILSDPLEFNIAFWFLNLLPFRVNLIHLRVHSRLCGTHLSTWIITIYGGQWMKWERRYVKWKFTHPRHLVFVCSVCMCRTKAAYGLWFWSSLQTMGFWWYWVWWGPSAAVTLPMLAWREIAVAAAGESSSSGYLAHASAGKSCSGLCREKWQQMHFSCAVVANDFP